MKFLYRKFGSGKPEWFIILTNGIFVFVFVRVEELLLRRFSEPLQRQTHLANICISRLQL